jgi:hypothetical protein
VLETSPEASAPRACTERLEEGKYHSGVNYFRLIEGGRSDVPHLAVTVE